MPNFNFLIISFAVIFLFCAGEVIKWKSDYSEFRPNDGVCTLVIIIFLKLSQLLQGRRQDAYSKKRSKQGRRCLW